VSKYYVPPEVYDDTINDLFLRLDRCVIGAVKKDSYSPKQIYNYIKMITNGHLVNVRFGKKYMMVDDMCWDEKEDFAQKFEPMQLEATYLVDKIYDYIIKLKEPKRSVMIMKMFAEKDYSNSQIGKIVGLTSDDIAEIYKKTKYKLKKHLVKKF
jgi:RNA polymerase sigma factor (sigma-70 family)